MYLKMLYEFNFSFTMSMFSIFEDANYPVHPGDTNARHPGTYAGAGNVISSSYAFISVPFTRGNTFPLQFWSGNSIFAPVFEIKWS